MNLLEMGGVGGTKSSGRKLTPHFEYGYITTPGNFLNLKENKITKR